MKVPLTAYSNRKDLVIVRNKEKITIPNPVKPTCYIKRGFQGLPNGDRAIWENGWYDLWTKDPIEVYRKTDFKDTMEYYKFKKAHADSGYVFGLPYMEQVLIQRPDFFTQYANDQNITKFTFDIEVRITGDGRFPRAETSPIIAIAYKVNDEPVQVIDNYDEKCEDEFIVRDFLKAYEEIDPDVIIGYNCLGMSGEGFDIPYLIKRAEKHGLNITKLSRWGEMPYEIKNDEIKYKFYGRCIFDIFNFVAKDQSLMGIKNRKLETVSRWYGLTPYKIGDFYTEDNSKYIGTEELRKHVTSDVQLTADLAKIYFPLQQSLAEMMNIPFDLVTNCYASFIPKIFSGRNLFEIKMIPFQSNDKRYLGHLKFQAALTNLERQGYHKDIWGIDAASFYPSLMRTFNLSPECVTLVKYCPKKDHFDFTSDGKCLWVKIPDENFDADILLKIDLTFNGFMRREMDKFFDMRNNIKKQMKVCTNEDEKTALKSQSDAIKVLMNSIYGIQGLNTTWLGDAGVAIGIAALARWILGSVIKYYGNHVIAYDTDGIYLDCESDLVEINRWVGELIESKTNVKSRVNFEFKGKYCGYFHKTKNYILRDEKGKFERHGVSMKSSRNPKFYDEIINMMSTAILDGKEEKDVLELSRNLYSLSQFDLEDFLMITRMTKLDPDLAKSVENMSEDDVYKNPKALQPFLMKRAREMYGRNLKVGDSIEYYRLPKGYALKEEVKSVEELDMKYYRDVALKGLHIFRMDPKSINDKCQCKLGFWMDENGAPIDMSGKKKPLIELPNNVIGGKRDED